MKKSVALLISVLLVLTLIIPATVLASGRGGGGRGHGKHAGAANAPTATRNEHTAAGHANKGAKVAAKDAHRAARLEAKTHRKGPKRSLESSPTSPSVKPSIEGTKSVGPGVANALEHIVANLTRKFAKFGGALPQGLVNVWFKFSTWLGISTETRPWEPPPTLAPVGDNPPPSEITTPPPSAVPSTPPGVTNL